VSQFQSVSQTHVALNILRLLRPYRVKGFGKTRVGRFFDGGYVMLDNFSNVTAAYSLGINDDVSWDLDVASYGIKVFQYDHTIDDLPIHHELFVWQKVGIGSVADIDGSQQTIPNLIAKNGHQNASELIMKCDIEGDEWPVLAALPSDNLKQFSQIVLELHHFDRLDDHKIANMMRSGLCNMAKHHRAVHIHANNHAPWVSVGGVPIPSVLEVTFARKDTGIFTPSDELFPTPLDMPCDSTQADFYLGRFVFD
jgi:hypothetical protein